MARKWNYQTHKYEDYDLPKNAMLYTSDLCRTVACASCGKPVIAADTFTSFEIHNDIGFGYMVCENCYGEENERKQKDRQNEII